MFDRSRSRDRFRVLASCATLIALFSTTLSSPVTGQAGPSIPSADLQIAAAVLPLPESMRAGATVLGYRSAERLELLRKGTNAMTCLADNPADPRFHVACYHDSLEPFMARGRELRANGVTGPQVDTVRFAEVMSGKLPMPKTASTLYQISAAAGAWNPATNTVEDPSPLIVIYIAGATEASTGLSTTPSAGRPWLMFPGTPKAHVMFTPTM